MKELQNKQKFRRVIYSTPSLLIIFILVLIFGRGVWGAINKQRASSEKRDEIEMKITSLEAREVELRANITKLGTEEGIKEEIKSKFNVSEEGENFIVIVDPVETDVATTTIPRPWYDKWWNGLRNLW